VEFRVDHPLLKLIMEEFELVIQHHMVDLME
jgi:hypothetical protein